ncbi:DUF1576 domain-containing protein [Fusobacterium hwasookii]|uniref:DUF1576 domain-containing protein n=1 Tax=Fusobacterium hwasookii ChDC F128 TaxID=1216362 RepID=A0ABP2R6M6_9FUSO|nr:DUF1576 domain-containing protein [Fusobacterium hwasookii]EJU08553.1 hypothetical protein B437_00445 [Fusobacterium hwasookii ChDC F128]QNE67163.1 DUF1576 domain-containing protein [Fusobacterium hwasookii]
MDKINQRMKEIELLTVSLSMLILIFFITYVINEHENIFIGMYKIITSPAVLVTDFIKVGGIGAAFLNAILIFSFNFFLVKSFKVKITGITIAAFFTVLGFSFFGKNILNILPFYLGGILYSIYTSTDFSEHIIPIAFSSALAPFVSSVAFYGEISYETSYINAILIGVLIGFIVVPLAKSLYDFHEGYDLYNLGFTAGILGSVIIAVLKLYHFEITPQYLLSTEYDIPLKVLCSSLFLSLIIIGFYINDSSLSGYFSLMKDDGYKSDFVKKYGYGLTFINMGVMGFISIGFVIITGQTFNGPILAGVFTVVGFSANGKTVFNTFPILVGILLASLGSKGNDFTLAISGLFGTALAPISGVFGPIAGIIAGWLHLAVVQNVGLVHGGLNLYNNGFSAGIVAGFLLPIFNMITDNNNQRKMNIQRKHMNFLKTVQANIKKKMKEDEDKEIK